MSRALPPINTNAQKIKGKDKLKKILEAIAMQISSSEDEDDTTPKDTQDDNPYGGPLSQDPFEN
ncbi:unnamed protein product [Thlaspi arvense]|uniref:Uncharacterized protein n=1 Tax=Thlaspi arvense TaxID=13288 RepID=A0AAU9SLC1_THLAR|nr:unnamed protein product [Thlaspi arvense]